MICEFCNDTGSRDKLGTYLDCNACGTASMRRDLNDFVKSLGPTHPEDVALAIHQRALAMAPNQEGPRQWVAIKDSAWVNIVNHDHAYDGWDKDDIINHVFKLTEAKCKELNGPEAAPAAANGALTDEQIYHFWIYRDCHNAIQSGDHRVQFISAARALLSEAGPDSALIEALKVITETAERCDSWQSFPQAPIDAARAALSGAKGN